MSINTIAHVYDEEGCEHGVTYECYDALRNSFDALTEANKTARDNLAALITRPELRAHWSDIPTTLNEADRQCIADAFNALKVSP